MGNFTYTYNPHQYEFVGCFWASKGVEEDALIVDLVSHVLVYLMVMDIVDKTNWYATTIDDDKHVPCGVMWKLNTIAKLKVFLAITLNIGMKK